MHTFVFNYPKLNQPNANQIHRNNERFNHNCKYREERFRLMTEEERKTFVFRSLSRAASFPICKCFSGEIGERGGRGVGFLNVEKWITNRISFLLFLILLFSISPFELYLILYLSLSLYSSLSQTQHTRSSHLSQLKRCFLS